MAKLRFHWLGSPVAELDGQPLRLEMRKTLALLAYLCLSPHPPTRETLSTLFWPEFDQQHALSNLRRNLSSLANSLPRGFLYADRERIELRIEDDVQVDVKEFHSLLNQANAHNHLTNQTCDECIKVLESAVELYRGDFFEGFNLKDCPEFDDWQFFQREGLRAEFAGALEKLAAYYQQTRDWEKAITRARSWVGLDRLNEPAQRMLMKLYFLSGQKSAAIRQFEECRRILDQELGQSPETETLELYDEIRKETPPESRREPSPAGVKTPARTTDIPLIKTKFFLPKVPKKIIHRPRLVSKLNQSVRMPVTLISASAGFGKTTLLAEWVTQSQDRVAWVSLDRSDNNPYGIVDCIASAIRNVLPGTKVGSDALNLLHTPQPVQITVILGSLINDLIPLPHNLILVLDDYHQIDSPAAHEVISFLLDHLPENLHLIISTRSDPPLSLGRLRASVHLSDIRTDDLRFTSDETQLFLTQAIGFPLSAQDMVSFEDKVEGWIAGIQLAALAMQSSQLSQSSSELRSFFRSFKGSHRYILDYLMEEVLNHQSEEVRTFLLKTSILENMCGSLCDAVLVKGGGTNPAGDPRETTSESVYDHPSAVILDSMERANLFLMPLDDERKWYRYHHLFADLLRVRLDQIYPGLAQKLHMRAAAWHEQNGSILEAIQHASIASEDAAVERLIEENYLEIMNRGENSSVRFWMGKLSKEMVYRRPWLCLYDAFNRSWFGKLEEANVLLSEAEKSIRSNASAPDTQAMLGYHSYVLSRVTAMQGDTRRAIALCLAARENTPADKLALQIEISITLGFEYFLYGDFVNANKTFDDMLRECYAIGAINNPVATYAIQARIQVVQGRLQSANDLLRKADQLIHAAGDQYLGASGLVQGGIAALMCERNEVMAALDRVKQALDFLPFWGKPDDLCLAYTALSRIQLALGKKIEAAAAIDKAAQLIHAYGVFSEARSEVEASQVKLWLVQGDWLEVDRWAATLEKRFDPNNPFRYEDELAHITQARVYLAQKKPGEAIRLLSCLEESAQSGERQGRLIEIMLLSALALQAAGDNTRAEIALTKSLELGKPGGYVRVFLDEGQPVERLLAQWLAHQASANPLREYAIHLLSQFEAEF